MEKTPIQQVNGEMWIFAALLIGIVIIQAVIFLRLALKWNKRKNYFSDTEVHSLLKLGSVSVIGPSMSVMVVALSLISMVGSGITFMRVGVIGAAGYEMMIADTAANAIGIPFNSPEFTASTLVLCAFGMAFASIPYFVTTPIECYLMDKATAAGDKKEGAKKKSFLPYMGNAAMMGLMGYFCRNYLTKPRNWFAALPAGIVVVLIAKYCAKSGKKGLQDWSITIAMLVGMTCAQVFTTMLGI